MTSYKKSIDIAREQIHEGLSSVYQIGSNAAKNMELSVDLEILTELIVQYIRKNNPDYEFTNFYDETFTESFKSLIKDQETFTKLLDEQKMSVEDFVKIRCIFSSSLFYNASHKIYKKKLS